MRKLNNTSDSKKEIKTFNRQKLPHIYPIGATFFITFRLHGSLPEEFLKKLELEYEVAIQEIDSSNALNKAELKYHQQKLLFKKYDNGLHKVYNGVDYLKNNVIANLVAKKIKEYDGRFYKLLSYSILSNHVHLVFDTSLQLQKIKGEVTNDNYIQVSKIMQLIKGGSSYQANQILKRRGKFWQKESYDHYARNFQELKNINFYTVKNPEKAGIVKDWKNHEFTFLCESWLQTMGWA